MANEAPMEIYVFFNVKQNQMFRESREWVLERKRELSTENQRLFVDPIREWAPNWSSIKAVAKTNSLNTFLAKVNLQCQQSLEWKLKHFLFSSLTLLKFLEMINFLAKAECFHIWTSVSCHSFLVSSKYHPATKKFSYNFSTLLKM